MIGADVGAAIVEAALHHTPGLLGELLLHLTGAELEGALSPLEGAPLAAFRRPEGAWLAITVVDQIDDERRAGWPALVSLLSRHHGSDGDLVVLTSSKDTARWARKLQHRDGPLGTRLTMAPLVVHAGLDEAERLVVEASPLTALIAAWAVHRKDGPRSRRVLAAALQRIDELEAPRRSWWLLATLRLLSGPQLAHIASMRHALPRSEAFAQFCSSLEAQAEARGKAATLLRLLAARALPLSPDQRAFITRCQHLPTVDRWLDVAFASSEAGPLLEAIFEPADPPVLPDPTEPDSSDMPPVDLLTPDPSPVTLDPTSLPSPA